VNQIGLELADESGDLSHAAERRADFPQSSETRCAQRILARIQKLARKEKNVRLDLDLTKLLSERPIREKKHDRTKASAIQIRNEIEERDFTAAELGGVVDVENGSGRTIQAITSSNTARICGMTAAQSYLVA
jgi:hypothetical protein